MNLVDIIIILFLIISRIIGAKRGVFKELIICLGTILVFYLAYQFKNPVGEFLLLRVPLVFDFPNLFKGVVVLNILVYQLLSFVIILALLLIIYNVIVGITGLFEKILKLTIILAIPSKILGFIVGVIEGYVIAFVILFFLGQPAFSFEMFMDSKLSNTILSSSPVLTNITKDTVDTINEIYELKDEKDTNVLNTKILDIMLDKGVVKYDVVEQIHKDGKLNFEGIDDVLERHKGDK